MDNKLRNINLALLQLTKREDELYHRYGTSCGLSDPALWILYTLYLDEGKAYTQNDLVTMWFHPKQTINYTVNSLVKKGWLALEHVPGARNSKAIRLTEEGRRQCQEKIRPLMDAEDTALLGLTETERGLLVKLYGSLLNSFEGAIQKIIGE